jgi:hypothetical protein
VVKVKKLLISAFVNACKEYYSGDEFKVDETWGVSDIYGQQKHKQCFVGNPKERDF